MYTALVRVERVVSLRSLSSVPPTYIGHFQISSFFHVFNPLSSFLSAGWPYDLCCTDTMMPLGPISLKPTHLSLSACACRRAVLMSRWQNDAYWSHQFNPAQHTHITPRPVSPRHHPQTRQHGTHHGRDRDPRSAHTTEIEAPGATPRHL